MTAGAYIATLSLTAAAHLLTLSTAIWVAVIERSLKSIAVV